MVMRMSVHLPFLIFIFCLNEISINALKRGTKAKMKDYPYHVFLYPEYCSGSIINLKWILTAAQCYNPDMNVYAGAARFPLSMGVLYTIAEFHQHPLYKKTANISRYDFMLVKLEATIYFEDNVDAIAMGVRRNIIGGDMGTFAGFGGTYKESGGNSLLHKLHSPIVDRQGCISQPNKKFLKDMEEIQFCIGDKSDDAGMMQGDIGSGFVVGKYLIGVLTGCGKIHTGCSESPGPTFVASVPHVSEWIINVSDVFPRKLTRYDCNIKQFSFK